MDNEYIQWIVDGHRGRYNPIVAHVNNNKVVRWWKWDWKMSDKTTCKTFAENMARRIAKQLSLPLADEYGHRLS